MGFGNGENGSWANERLGFLTFIFSLLSFRKVTSLGLSLLVCKMELVAELTSRDCCEN